MDPLGHMMLGSEDYRYFMQVMQVSQGLWFKVWVLGWGSPAVVSVLMLVGVLLGRAACWKSACLCATWHHLQAGLSGPRADCAACGFACVFCMRVPRSPTIKVMGFLCVLTSQEAAERHCQGRVVAVHEGGYSELYVPFCGLAVIEQLAYTRSKVRRLTCASCLL